jgi:hypothetical protein
LSSKSKEKQKDEDGNLVAKDVSYCGTDGFKSGAPSCQKLVNKPDPNGASPWYPTYVTAPDRDEKTKPTPKIPSVVDLTQGMSSISIAGGGPGSSITPYRPIPEYDPVR